MNKKQKEDLARAIEARVIRLIDQRVDSPARKEKLLSQLSGARPIDRARLLLFAAVVIAARRGGRGFTEQEAEIAVHDYCNVRGDEDALQTPEGRFVERHKMLLARLVYQGCQRRGEVKEEAIKK